MTEKPTYHCANCGHSWHPRKAETPKVCPKCHSHYWQVGPQRASRSEQLKNAAEKRAQEVGALRRIPVTDDFKRDAYSAMGIFKPVDTDTFTLGTTNAGPWLESAPESELPRMAMLDLVGFQPETDTMFVVNDKENNGICLSGDDIYPGDVIHFRKGLQPSNGNIVLAEGYDTDGRWFVTCKHWHQRGVKMDGLPVIELRPSNHNCKIIRVFPANVLEVSVAISVTKMALHKRRRPSK